FYTWDIPNVSNLSVTGGVAGSFTTTISGNLNNGTSLPQTAVYLVTPSFGQCAGGNAGNQFTVTVFVNPAPAITNIFRTICTGTSFVVTPTNGTNGFVPDGTTYTWGLPTVTSNSVTGGQSNSTSASSIFGGDLINPTSSSQTAVYYVVPVLGTCTGAGFSVFITIDPKPAITPMSRITCSGVGFVVSPVDGTNGLVPANTRYAWSPPSGTNIGNGQPATNQLTINGTLTNSVNVQRTATYLVTPSFGACSGLSLSGNQFTVTVFVDPTPAITSFTTSPICTGTSFAVTPTSAGNIIPSNTLYGWGAPTPEVASLSGGQPSAFSSTNIFSGTLFNPTKQQFDYVYT
ncbi:MAG: PKD-like domain-containing protein, partial [bacterium]